VGEQRLESFDDGSLPVDERAVDVKGEELEGQERFSRDGRRGHGEGIWGRGGHDNDLGVKDGPELLRKWADKERITSQEEVKALAELAQGKAGNG
jgi:hypothetical protein